jgi:hypothetical protein
VRKIGLLARLRSAWPTRRQRRHAPCACARAELWDLHGEVGRLRRVGVQHAGLAARAEMRAHRAEGLLAVLEAEVAALRADVAQLREELAFAWSAGRLEVEVVESAGLAATVIDLGPSARTG